TRKHRVVVVRPARGERDTCDNGDPNYDGAAPMDPPPPGAPAHRTILALSVAVAEAETDYAEQAEQQRGKSHMKYGDSCQDGMWGVGREERDADAQQACHEADHTIRQVAAGGEVHQQAGTDGPKVADEPIAHVGVVVVAQRW